MTHINVISFIITNDGVSDLWLIGNFLAVLALPPSIHDLIAQAKETPGRESMHDYHC